MDAPGHPSAGAATGFMGAPGHPSAGVGFMDAPGHPSAGAGFMGARGVMGHMDGMSESQMSAAELELLCDAMEMLAAQQDNNVDVDVSFGLEFTALVRISVGIRIRVVLRV